LIDRSNLAIHTPIPIPNAMMMMMYEMDPSASTSGGFPPYRDDDDDTRTNDDDDMISAAVLPSSSGRPVYSSNSGRRLDRRSGYHHGNSSDDDRDDDEVLVLPASLRRIFLAGGVAAFLLVVLLAASTMSVVVVEPDLARPLPGASHGGRDVAAPDTPLRQRDEQAQDESATSTSSSSSSSFASSMVSLVEAFVNETVHIVVDAANNNNEDSNSGGSSSSGSSPSFSPVVKKTPSPTTTRPVAPPVPAPPTSGPPPSAPSSPSSSTETEASPTTAPDANGIKEGTVNGVAYYSCRATSNVEKTILLFHGASFTKEQWKESGILQSLCSQSTLTTYAFDMSVSSTADDLKALMDTMLQSNLIASLPVNAIVTPSASGSMVVDWGERTTAASNGSSAFAPMINYWKLWVPVASPAVAYVSPKSLLSSMFPNIDILAVHGDQDTSGGRVMGLLETYANATGVTISGGHACYMQSPDDFVKAVLAEVM
jgi:hypothetical protein